MINANNSGALGIAMTNGITTGDGQHSATLNINSSKDLTINGFARGILVNANNNLNINIGGKFDLMAGSISDNFRGINLGNKLFGTSDRKDIINFSLTANDDINITDYKSGFLVSVGGNLTSTVTSQNGRSTLSIIEMMVMPGLTLANLVVHSHQKSILMQDRIS